MSSGYLLDTNVLSELMRNKPEPAVMAWFAHHAEHQMHTGSITQAEVLSGIAMLPQGKRRDRLAHAAYQVFEREFAQHCLPFDQGAARQNRGQTAIYYVPLR